MATIEGNKKKLTVKGELIESAVNSRHEHSNSAVLDKLSDNNGTLQYNGSDITGGGSNYTLPTASETVLGGVMVDGTTITVNSEGIISATSTGTGLTEEQANNVAKIPTIENNVTTNTNSISNLETRVTQVESAGISDEVINKKITDYVASNGVLTEGSVMPEHLNSSIFNGQEQLVVSNQLGTWQTMKLIYDISGVTTTSEYNYKIKGSITLDKTMNTPIKMKNSTESSLNYDVQTAKATAGIQLDISKEFTNTNLFDTVAFIGENSGLNGKYNNIRLFINNKECPRINYTTSGGNVTVSTFGDKVATQEYVENYVTTSPIGDSLVTYSSLNDNIFGYSVKIANSGSHFPKVRIKSTSPSGKKRTGLFTVIADITTKNNISKYGFNIGQWNADKAGTTKHFEIAPNRYLVKSTVENTSTDDYTCLALTYNVEGDSINCTINNITVMVAGERQLINEFAVYESSDTTTFEVLENKGDIATKEYINNLLTEMNSTESKPKLSLSFVNNLYLVCNDNSDSENFNALSIYLDYLYDGSKKDRRVTFKSGEEFKVLASDPNYEDMPKDILINKKAEELLCDYYDVEDIQYNKVMTKASLVNPNIFCLTIGDSVTAGAVTDVPYYKVCADHFAKEDIDFNRTSNVHFLGNIQSVSSTLNYRNKTKEVQACACGVSSWSLRMWLNEDNNGKPNGFCYTDGEGSKQFSILKWIERYRTMDDDGNKLELTSPNIGTMITENNINKIKCCTPNVIYINSTHNDDPANIIADHEKIIEVIQKELPDCKIIIASPMPLIGTWWGEKYAGVTWYDRTMEQPNHSFAPAYAPIRLKSLKYWNEVEKSGKYRNVYAMPQYVCTPTVDGFESRDYQLCNGKTMKMYIDENQMINVHPSTVTHKNWGYELYAMLKYLFCKDNEGVTTNEVTVTLDNATANLTVGGTTTITGTPSDSKSAVTYTSSNTSIATVDSAGLVTAVSAGTCYIYAETDKTYQPAVCTVTVTE